MRRRLLDEWVAREIRVGEAQRTRRQYPALELMIAMQIAETLESVGTALGGTLGHRGRHGDFPQIERSPFLAEGLENGLRLFDGLVVQWIAFRDSGFFDRPLLARHGLRVADDAFFPC